MPTLTEWLAAAGGLLGLWLLLMVPVLAIRALGPWTCGNCRRGLYFQPVPRSGCGWCGWRPGIDPPRDPDLP